MKAIITNPPGTKMEWEHFPEGFTVEMSDKKGFVSMFISAEEAVQLINYLTYQLKQQICNPT